MTKAMRKLCVTLLLMATGNALAVDTHSVLEAERAALRGDRQAIVARNLELTEAQAKAFWPIYNEYGRARMKVGDRLVALVESYASQHAALSDEKALELIQEYVRVQADTVEVKRKYLKTFAAAVPGKTVARFYQIENRLDAIVNDHLMRQIPMVVPAAAAAPTGSP